MASVVSNQEGIFKTCRQTDEEKLVSNFSIAIKAVVNVDTSGGGPGLLVGVVRLPDQTEKLVKDLST